MNPRDFVDALREVDALTPGSESVETMAMQLPEPAVRAMLYSGMTGTQMAEIAASVAYERWKAGLR